MSGGNRRECPFQLGKYRFIEPLGSGTQGDVYLAEREGALGFRRKLAVKIVDPLNDLGRERAVKSLANEARGLAEVFHPNVVQVFDFSKVDDKYLLVMEYVDGINVDRILRSVARPGHAIDTPEALIIAEQVARGLACVHGLTDRSGKPSPMVHRDLKPSNVVVSRHGLIKLVDFGLVKGKQIAFHTMVPNITRGTPSYMSPEQVRGEALTPASDQFSLGTLLYEMLAGEPMFRDDSEQAVMFRVVEGRPSGDPSHLREACPEVIPVLARCLTMDPTGRYEHTEELADTLHALLQGQPRDPDLRGLLARVDGRPLPTPPRPPVEDRAAPRLAPPVPPPPGPPSPPARRGADPFRPPPADHRPPAPQPLAMAPEPPALGKDTERFFYGEGQGPPAAVGAPTAHVAPQLGSLGADTQAFFFGPGEREALRQPAEPAQIGPSDKDRSGTAAVGKSGGFKDLMSKDVSFRVARPIRRVPAPAPAEGDDDGSGHDDDDSGRPPWERDR